ncbi:hypothetical protein SLS58_010728 [Diplodia intermedia]|uniref:Uncharacterized protein n=1 Tax=Diplodia intermedia TaxID=856260 RepID=A0ABR3T4Q8_9PEZI
MHFIQKLDVAIMAGATIFLIVAILALVLPAERSARILKFLDTLPSAARSICSSAAYSAIRYAWIFFFCPLFFLILWCLVHMLSYLWDTAMEYLMYTEEERLFRWHCRNSNEAERCRARKEEYHNEQIQLLRKQQEQQRQQQQKQQQQQQQQHQQQEKQQEQEQKQQQEQQKKHAATASPGTPSAPQHSTKSTADGDHIATSPQGKKNPAFPVDKSVWPPVHKSWAWLEAEARRRNPNSCFHYDFVRMHDGRVEKIPRPRAY